MATDSKPGVHISEVAYYPLEDLPEIKVQGDILMFVFSTPTGRNGWWKEEYERQMKAKADGD